MTSRASVPLPQTTKSGLSSYAANSLSQTPYDNSVALVKVPPVLTNLIPNTIHPIDNTTGYLFKELAVSVLDEIDHYLWMAGLSANKIRPLHRQKVIGRQIIVAEQPGLHLVWHRQNIFVKPIPRCLLHYEYFEHHIRPDPRLYNLAMAFLSTYLALIQHESDFDIALELKLIPVETTWDGWLKFAEQLNRALIDPLTRQRMVFKGRYGRGELRLPRLDLIMIIFRGQLRGYAVLDTDYNTYFSSYLTIVFLAFAYVGIALNAFQVAIGSTNVPPALHFVGYWFSVVVLLVLVFLIMAPTGWFVVLLVHNLAFACKNRRPR